jgi:hypothetical protein
MSNLDQLNEIKREVAELSAKIDQILDRISKSPLLSTLTWEADKTPSGIQLTGATKAVNKASLIGSSLLQTPQGPALIFILKNHSDGAIAMVSPDFIKSFD